MPLCNPGRGLGAADPEAQTSKGPDLDRGLSPSIALTHCAALGQRPNLSEPQLPLPENRFGNSNTIAQGSCAG